MTDTISKFNRRNMCLMKMKYKELYDACYKEKSKNFNQFGACGIRMCKRWKRSFACFYMDMVDTYNPYYVLCIIDRTKQLDCNNVKWERFINREIMYLYVKHKDGLTKIDEYMKETGLTFSEVNEQRKQKLVLFRKGKA